MIDQNTALSCVALATIADNKSLVIKPVGSTPLAELVNCTNLSTYSLLVGTAAPVDNIQSYSNYLELATSGKDGLLSNHDVLMDSYVPQIAAAVASHVSFAKNVVAPIVIEMADNVKKAMQYVKPAASEFCINIVDLPLPMQNNSFEESVSKYAGKTLYNPGKELSLESHSHEEILDLIRTGSKNVDSDIELWYASLSGEFVMKVWDNVFRDFKISKPSVVMTIEQLCSDKETGVNAALLIYLLARKLYDEVPVTTNMGLSSYTGIVSALRDYAGTCLNIEYTRYNAVIKNGSLIASVSPNRKTINVNGSVYRQWLKTGGTNEVILGMVVSNATLYTTTLIDQSSTRFLEAWNTYQQYSNTATRNENFNKFKQTLKICFANGLNTLSEVEQELMQEKPDMSAKIASYFDDELSKLRNDDMLDIYGECLKLVCRSRFFYTDAEKILQGINDAVKMNPNISVRDAAAMSTCEYIIDYISDQMQVTT